jgi:hypothetical protein
MLDVVITIHRKSVFINDALASLSIQTVLPKRVVIVFNGYPTNVDFIDIPENISKITSIHFCFNKFNANYSRNCGLFYCKSSLISFLDFDDIWFNTRIEHIIESHKNFDWDIYYNNFLSGKLVGRKKLIIANDSDLKFRNSIGGFSSVVFTSNALIKIGLFDEDLDSCQDWDVWIRAQSLSLKFFHNKTFSTLHRIGDLNTITQNLKSQYTGMRHFYFKHRLFLDNQLVKELYIRRLLLYGSFLNQVTSIKLISPSRYLRFLLKKFIKILIK